MAKMYDVGVETSPMPHGGEDVQIFIRPAPDAEYVGGNVYRRVKNLTLKEVAELFGEDVKIDVVEELNSKRRTVEYKIESATLDYRTLPYTGMDRTLFYADDKKLIAKAVVSLLEQYGEDARPATGEQGEGS